MPQNIAARLTVCAAALAACAPTFDWREVRAEPTALRAMLPCKPDKGARTVSLAGRQVSLEALGCDTGGATFAVLFTDLGDPALLGEVLSQWKAVTLLNLHAASGQETPFRPPGALGFGQSLQVAARGQRADGSKVESRAAYFARGTHVFQAVIYAGQITQDTADTFFSGLRFE